MGWILNRRKDFKDGKSTHNSTNNLDGGLRNDLERLKRCRNHRGLRHYWGLKVRGQHTKTTGRGRWMMMMAKAGKAAGGGGGGGGKGKREATTDQQRCRSFCADMGEIGAGAAHRRIHPVC